MSEKQVNIKITASTKDFDNAIKKAQKQIEELADAIDTLGSSKFGNKLEEQFDDLVKALKKAEEEVSNIQKTFDDLSKIKLNKAEDGLKDVAKAGEDLNNTLEKTTDNIEGIDKVKFNKIDQQFKDIVASGEDVSTKAKDILDLLDKVDKQDLNGLESEFNQIHSALEKISTETRNSTEDMETSFREVTEEVNDFINKLNDVDYVHFNEFSDVLQDANKRLEELTEQQNKFNKATGELDSSGIDKFADSMNKINGANGTVNMKNDSSNKGKSNNSLTDGITEGLASSIIEGKILKDTMDDVADSIKDAANSMDRFQNAADEGEEAVKPIGELGGELEKAEVAINELGKEYEDLIAKQKDYEKAIKDGTDAQKIQRNLEIELADALSKKKKEIAEIDAEMQGYKKTVDDFNKKLKQQQQAILDAAEAEGAAEEAYHNCREELDKLEKEYEDLSNALDKALNSGDQNKIDSLAEQWSEVGTRVEETKKQVNELNKAWEDADNKVTDESDRLEALKGEKEAVDQAAKAYDDLIDKYDKLRKEAKELEDELEGAINVTSLTELQAQANKFDLSKVKQQLADVNEEKKKLEDRKSEIGDIFQGKADEFDKQYKAFDRLGNRVNEFLSDEKKSIALRGQIAEAFDDLARAMDGVYKESTLAAGAFSNFSTVPKVIEEAKKYFDSLNLVSFDNVTDELDKLNQRLENTIDKQKRYKAISQEFGTDDSKLAYSLKMQCEALRDWADSADFVIEAADTLTKAWGDVSAAGEDHLKIRERSKYIDEYGKTLEENVKHIQSYYKELKTLDEVYEKATGEERAVIDDYKHWEHSKEKLEDYNQAIRDYLTVIKESGGQISDKFKDDLGNFDVKKFIANYEKFGEANNVLKKQMEARKVVTLAAVESLIKDADANKKAAKEAVKHAEAVRDQAKEQQKAAQTAEERTEAAKKLARAEEELAEAKKKLKDFDQDLINDMDKLIKKFNTAAEAARKLGINMKDISKIDIGKIEGGGSFASILDGMKTFGDDLPKSLDDFKRQVQGIFAEMEGFDLGGVFDGLKELGAGLLGKLPNELKLAAGFAGLLAKALKECAESGIDQLGKGVETLKNALSGMAGIARDIGQEIGDAFSNITGMELDFSSLMEIPVNFESQMAKVGAIAGATGDDFKELEEEARRLGATTRYSATEVAEAMEYMGMAGWTNTQILAKSKDGLSALESVLKLATVAQMDLGQASDFVTDGLTALGMEAEEASYMVDILAKASTSSNTTVAQMQRAFTNCAPVAGTLGINIKDLSLALGLMADKGVKGAKAGTALKNLMSNLSAPTEKQLEYIKEFNLQGAQQDIVNGRLLDGLKKFKSALSSLTPQQQNAVITTIAGKEALSGISALLNTTEEDLNKLESALNNCDGAAKNMADGFDDTLEGALKGLASAMQETLLQLRDMTKEAEDSIKNIVNDIADFFHILNGFKESSSGLTGLAGAFEHLEETTQKWGDNIADRLEKAIGAIDNFINGPIFDDILQAGTNIINGIADGIKRAAKDGTLDSAISGAIKKISTWFSENLDTIVEVGKEIIEAISKGISENSDEIGEVIKTVMEMQTEIDKAIAKEKWKLIGQNLISFICEGIVSKTSVFVSAFTGFFEGCIGDIANAFNDLVVNKLSPMLLDPIAVMGEGIGNFLKEVLLSALERAFDIDLSYFKDFNIFKPSSWFGDKDKKKNKSNKKSNSSNKGKKDSSSGSGWDNFKKELSGWGKAISDWGADIGNKASDAWDGLCDKFSKGGEKTSKSASISWSGVKKELSNWGDGISTWGTNVGDDISNAWTNIKGTLDSWGDGISEWSSNTGTWFSDSWSSAKEKLSQWKTGISEWGTETSEELSKAGNNIKTFFTETLPSYFNPEKLGSALGTFTGTISRVTVDAWESFNTWGEDLYNKGSEAAINYSNGIRDFIVELPGNVSTWLTNAWTAVDTWGENLYIKGSEAAIKYSNGIRDFFAELPDKISTWVTNAWTAVDTWGNDLYTKGSEAAIKYSDGIRDYFAELYNKISTWLTDAWSAVDTWGTNLYTKGSEAAIRYSDGIRDFFVQLPGKITTWLSNATKSFTKWCNELYTKGKEAINNLAKGISEGLRQLPGKITSGLNSGKKAVTNWGNDVKKSASSAGKNIVNGIFSGMSEFKSAITNWCSRFKSSFLSSFKKAFGIHSPSTVMRDEVGVNLALGIEEGLNSGAGDIAQTAGNILSSVKGSIGNIWDNLFGNNDNPELLNISPEGIKAATASLNALSLVLTDAKENISTIGKTFNALGLSLTDVSEITNSIRAAFMSIANIIASQVTNARNVLTQQFLSMVAVARTQMVNISNIVRNQAVAWNNIIANQAKNARDNLTRQFISMAKVASTQMGKVTAAVRSSMNSITAATSRGISINVNRSVSTGYTMPSANALYAANAASTYSLGGNTGALYGGASTMSTVSASSSNNSRGMSDNITLEIPLYLDGREVARATARYVDNELKLMTKRENRKRGAK